MGCCWNFYLYWLLCLANLFEIFIELAQRVKGYNSVVCYKNWLFFSTKDDHFGLGNVWRLTRFIHHTLTPNFFLVIQIRSLHRGEAILDTKSGDILLFVKLELMTYSSWSGIIIQSISLQIKRHFRSSVLYLSYFLPITWSKEIFGAKHMLHYIAILPSKYRGRKDSLPSTNKIPLHNRIVYCHVLNMLWGYYVKCHQDYGNPGKEV